MNEKSEPRNFSNFGARVGALLLREGLTISSAESCTGGTIASMLAAVAGSSAYFKGSVVSYAVEVKQNVLGVNITEGVVSESTAAGMAEGVARLLQTDVAVSTTGIAGPGGAEPGKPVGTVCMAVHASRSMGRYSEPVTLTYTYHFDGDREQVILQAADAALRLVCQLISGDI